MTTFTFNQNIQPELRSEILKTLECWQWLIPTWCQRIHVNLWGDTEGGSEGEMISIRVHYEYREACLNFICGWLNQPAEDRSFSVLHELLLHLPLSLIANHARDNYNRIVPKTEAPKFNESLQDELRVRHESATQDLAHAIWARTMDRRL